MKVTIRTASTMSQGLQKFYFSLTKCFGKNRTSISNTPHYSFFCLVIWHQYHFDTITYFPTNSDSSIQRRPLVFCKNGRLNFRKQTSISAWEKSEKHLENFWKLPSKTYMLGTFFKNYESFSKSCSEQLVKHL